MRDAYHIVRRPLVTEKGTGMAEKSNSYTFEVAPDANKVEIRKAIEKLFEVRVVSVHTMLRKGKSKGQGFRSWTRPNQKRAIVKLAPGQSIEFI